jgi:hypothetical protein
MTVQEMYEYTLELLNKEATASIFPEEWEILINACQLELVQNKYAKIDSVEKRIDDLRVLVVGPSPINNTGLLSPGGEIFDLPFVPNPLSGGSHGYMFMLSVALKLQFADPTCAVNGWIKAKPLRRDKRYEQTNDPWNKPTVRRLYYFLVGNQMKVDMGQEAYAVQANVEYLRHPIKIEIVNNVVDCELPPHMHKEICDLTCTKYLEQTESPRYNTFSNEQQTVNK